MGSQPRGTWGSGGLGYMMGCVCAISLGFEGVVTIYLLTRVPLVPTVCGLVSDTLSLLAPELFSGMTCTTSAPGVGVRHSPGTSSSARNRQR